MTIIHCDNCGAAIDKSSNSIAISRGLMFRGVELCRDCGVPAAELLDRVHAARQAREAQEAALRTATDALQ